MKTMRIVVATLLMMSVLPLRASEKNSEKNNVISDEDLAAKKKAFALELKNRKRWEWEYLHYPKDETIKIDVQVLNKELELPELRGIMQFGTMFIIPAGMDEKFIHKTLVPEKRHGDFIVGLVV